MKCPAHAGHFFFDLELYVGSVRRRDRRVISAGGVDVGAVTPILIWGESIALLETSIFDA
jgi:hypothetical protein